MGAEERWDEELQSAWLYRRLAQVEPEPAVRKMFGELAEAAEKQAGILLGDIRSAGGTEPRFRPSLRARIVAGLASVLRPRRVRPLLAAMKVRGLPAYDAPLLLGHPMPTSVAEVGARHRTFGASGSLRAAVFGVNDGLVSNAGLIMGVAGATRDVATIVMAGVAGLLAGALSMAAGEYISMRSQRELYEYQIGQEREELERYPEEEAEEMALIYSARGVPMEQARAMTKIVIQDKEQALKTLAREELGLNPDDLGSPWGAAISSLLAFAVGAVLPLLPFLLTKSSWNLPVAAVLSGAGLFTVGLAMSLFSGKSALWGGLRMLLIGSAAGAATHLIGRLLGVVVS